ncbi:MAG: cob(I)yrinic acid a,c-diamide adenosyltransferase [Clostridium sp.]|nr:cob(I)yrinic acid a,c-diamide adenosyltransferase [Prevotella sp.]MCM1428514.1 cob(I)yrinic acid a,c-diamide adenosyltransferase [Clostridium sp.]MCM1474962.1 cob(I)yrinic acid a,c-diamide adenosyltransferase [Muribaculaceae bacterium]
MAKSNLYTRTGDAGITSLVGGQRVKKSSIRLEAYGTLDEFSSFLGVVLSHDGCPQEVKGQLLEIQNRLFDLGCYLATEAPEGTEPKLKGIAGDIQRLEGWIDTLDGQTPKIRAFVLPGGSELSAHAHVARTVCRRAERRILALSEESYVDPALEAYVNRLSDYLFILARYLNFTAGIAELTWQSK